MEATQGYGASKVEGDDTLRMTPLPREVYGMFSSRAVEFIVYIYRCYVLLYVFFLYLLLRVPGKCLGSVLSQTFLTGLHCSCPQTNRWRGCILHGRSFETHNFSQISPSCRDCCHHRRHRRHRSNIHNKNTIDNNDTVLIIHNRHHSHHFSRGDS